MLVENEFNCKQQTNPITVKGFVDLKSLQMVKIILRSPALNLWCYLYFHNLLVI